MINFQQTFGYLVAEVRTTVDMTLDHVEVKKGTTVTVSNLDHPTDVKLWAGGQYKAKPSWFDLSNPVKIIRRD